MRTRKGNMKTYAIACGMAACLFATGFPSSAAGAWFEDRDGPSGPRTWDLMPPDERAFINAVLSGAKAYREGKDDAEKKAARTARAKQLCEILQLSNVSLWIGSIQQLSASADGKSAVVLQIMADVTVKTWGDASSDAQDKTLIAADDPLLAKLSPLKERRWMRFSGEFAKGEADCIKEAGATLEDSMTAPAFIFRFSDAAPF
jgi:hypothetical protein